MEKFISELRGLTTHVKTPFSSMYPHITIAFNIERNTMIGKLIIPGFEIEPYDHIFEGDMLYDNSSDDDDDDDEIEEPEFLKKYDAGRDFVENYLTDDLNTMGSRWFGLPTYEELHDKFVNVVETKPRKKFALSSLIKTIKDKIKAGFDI